MTDDRTNPNPAEASSSQGLGGQRPPPSSSQAAGALRPLLHVTFADQNVCLPLSPSAVDIGVVLDANGNEVFTVDVNGERTDEETATIADLVVELVNAATGFGEPSP